jgi:hypothetical protein
MHQRVVTSRGRCVSGPAGTVTSWTISLWTFHRRTRRSRPAPKAPGPGLGTSAGDVGRRETASLAQPPGPAVVRGMCVVPRRQLPSLPQELKIPTLLATPVPFVGHLYSKVVGEG